MNEWREALEMLRKQFDHENALPLYDLIETRMDELEAAEQLAEQLVQHWGMTPAAYEHRIAELEQMVSLLQPLYAFSPESWGALLAPDILPDYGEWDIWNAIHDLLRSIADTVNIQEAMMPKTKEELEIWLADGPETDEIIAHILSLEIHLEAYKRVGRAVRDALAEAIPNWEGSGASIVGSIRQLGDADHQLSCLREAGIDNVEAYSIGMQLYYERYEND